MSKAARVSITTRVVEVPSGACSESMVRSRGGFAAEAVEPAGGGVVFGLRFDGCGWSRFGRASPWANAAGNQEPGQPGSEASLIGHRPPWCGWRHPTGCQAGHQQGQWRWAWDAKTATTVP